MDIEPPLPEPLTPPSEPRFSTYSREFLDRRRDRGDRGDRHDRPHRAPLGDPRERGSKTLSMVLRHRQLPAMRKDGFIPWEAVLQCDELQGRYCSKDLVEVIEWSHNKDKQRRFEMALNLDDKGGIWVRATGRHTNGCDASQLPDGVTEATRSESDQNAMEAARRYSGPGSVREHRERGYPRHDFGRGPPRPVARPLDAAPPKPPVGVPVAPAPNGPTELPTIRKVISTQLAPPILEEPIREEPVRQGSDQSTCASITEVEVEPKQKGNKVDRKLAEVQSPASASSEEPGNEAAEVSKETPKEASSPGGRSGTCSIGEDSKGEQSAVPAETKSSLFQWPANVVGIGKARQCFDGEAWSQEHPDDKNHYITFDEEDLIARLPHAQDQAEECKEECLRWAFGLKQGTDVQGWYPQIFVDFDGE
ncbi:unnamed protein product [Durusdinium trenchii]|uniref:2'-phosphotransferase n=1 Tax=Durusdinium trenchii TaxID=1381693 RepID=A0ABP0Q6J1_9DINO